MQFDGDECLIWPFKSDKDGYARATFGGKRIYVHRLLCERVNGAPLTTLHLTAHNCGNGHLGCVNPKHLRWATPKENRDDMIGHGTNPAGERNPSAKLKSDQVHAIRTYRGSMTISALANKYAVSESTIYTIRAGSKWKCIGGENAYS